MTFANKLKLILLTFITFGLIWIWINKKQSKENELSKTNKIKVDVKKLKEAIGKDNITSITNTQNKIKVLFKDVKKVKKDEIQNLKGISGTLFSSTSVTLIVGNSAESLKEALSK